MTTKSIRFMRLAAQVLLSVAICMLLLTPTLVCALAGGNYVPLIVCGVFAVVALALFVFLLWWRIGLLVLLFPFLIPIAALFLYGFFALDFIPARCESGDNETAYVRCRVSTGVVPVAIPILPDTPSAFFRVVVAE